MTLKMRLNTDTSILVGFYFMGLLNSPYPALSSSDLISGALSRCLYPSPVPISCDRIFGYTGQPGTIEQIDKGYILSDEYNGYADFKKYGSTFHTLLSVVRGDNFSSFTPGREHNVNHFQAIGDVVPAGLVWNVTRVEPQRALHSGASYNRHLTGYGYTCTLPTLLVSTRSGLYCTYTESGSYPHNESDNSLFLVDDKLFGHYQQGDMFTDSSYPGSFGGHQILRLSNIRWTIMEDSIRLTYEHAITEDSTFYDGRWKTGKLYYGPFTIRYNVECVFNHKFLYAASSRNRPTSSESINPTLAFTSTETWKYTCVENCDLIRDFWADSFWKTQYPGVITTWTQSAYSVSLSQPFTSTSFPGSAGVPCSIHSSKRMSVQNTLRAWIDSNMCDLRAASALSTADAMSDLQSSSRTDVLQTIAKIPEISSQIPKIKEAIQIVRKLKGRELPIRDILDFLTQTRLQQSFQWRPEFDLLLKYLPQIPQIMLSFPDESGTLIGRGSYDYDFLNVECYRTLHLKVRTKIVAKNDLTSPLATYLKLDSLGILPTPANLWDLMPFSFVVNWFTNMGQRIRTMGTVANLWLLTPIVVVHSYTFTSPFTANELASMNLRAAPGSESKISMKIYIREVTKYVSYLASSRFDFQRPTRSPDWTIVASLIYQWMK